MTRRRAAVSLMLALAAPLVVHAQSTPQGAAAGAQAPGAADGEFWRTAERLGTVDAYNAYLAAFPNGAYAPSARAALAKAGADTKALPLPAPGASEPARNSTAVTFAIGDRFTGPAVVTVGWAGAKKQVVLPAGEWVVLSAVDWESNHVRPVKLTTVVFGKFLRGQLLSTLATTSSRVTSAMTAWSDIDECEKGDAAFLHAWSTRPGSVVRECQSIRVATDTLPTGATVRHEIGHSLQQLGAKTPGYGLLTHMFFADRVNGYLRIVRADCPVTSLDAGAGAATDWQPAALPGAPVRADYVKALTGWAEQYRELARDGFRRSLAQADAAPNGAPATRVDGIADFAPGKSR